MPVSDDIVKKFAEAIAHAEGFFADTALNAPNLPQRCHNPGNLTDDGATPTGHTARSAGYGAADITVYACDDDGWSALERKVRRMLNGASMMYPLWKTLGQVGTEYSRSSNWASNVAQRLGYPVTATLRRIADENQTAPPTLG